MDISTGIVSTTKKRKTDAFKGGCVDLVTNENFEPKTLFDTCIEFIGQNLQHAESLVGFPDLIGRKIFRCAEEHDCLKLDSKHSLKIITLFHNSYKQDILKSLNLRGCHMALGLYQDQFEIFTDLTQLDLGLCSLGDDHDFLQCVARLERLEALHLDGNFLSDNGVQKMTFSMNIKKRGPFNLKVLNLACNRGITSKSVQYLLRFKRLQLLDLSGTDIKDDGVSQLKSEGFRSSSTLCPVVETSGWAATIVESWKRASETTCQPKQRLSKSGFYSRKCILPTAPFLPSPTRAPEIVLERKVPLMERSPNSDGISEKNTSRNVNRKLNANINQCPYQRTSFASENGKGEGETVPEGDPMFASYLNVPTNSSKARRDNTLWSAMNSDLW